MVGQGDERVHHRTAQCCRSTLRHRAQRSLLLGHAESVEPPGLTDSGGQGPILPQAELRGTRSRTGGGGHPSVRALARRWPRPCCPGRPSVPRPMTRRSRSTHTPPARRSTIGSRPSDVRDDPGVARCRPGRSSAGRGAFRCAWTRSPDVPGAAKGRRRRRPGAARRARRRTPASPGVDHCAP